MPTVTDIGHIAATLENGEVYRFSPSFLHIAALGSPDEVVRLYAELHTAPMRPALVSAMHVLDCCSDDDDASEAIGWLEDQGGMLARTGGAIPDADAIILARHLLVHGVAGGAAQRGPSEQSGEYSARFDASEFVDAAMIHFGLSGHDAWRLTMTQFQRMLDLKYPDRKPKLPSEEAYKKWMAGLKRG